MEMDNTRPQMEGVRQQPRNPIATFVDNYGEARIIHRLKGRRLSVFNGPGTPVQLMNRATAILMGKRIRARRKALGLSAKELVQRAGFVDVNPKQRVYAIETAGREQGIKLGTLYALAHALECSPCDLLPPLEEVMKAAGVQQTEIRTIG